MFQEHFHNKDHFRNQNIEDFRNQNMKDFRNHNTENFRNQNKYHFRNIFTTSTISEITSIIIGTFSQ